MWTVKMSKEKIGGQGADLWLIPSILGAPLEQRQYICLSCIFTSRKLLFTPLTQDPRGDLWHGHTYAYTHSLTPTKLLLFSLYMRDKSATPGNDKQRGGGGVMKARLDKTAQRQLFVKIFNCRLTDTETKSEIC